MEIHREGAGGVGEGEVQDTARPGTAVDRLRGRDVVGDGHGHRGVVGGIHESGRRCDLVVQSDRVADLVSDHDTDVELGPGVDAVPVLGLVEVDVSRGGRPVRGRKEAVREHATGAIEGVRAHADVAGGTGGVEGKAVVGDLYELDVGDCRPGVEGVLDFGDEAGLEGGEALDCDVGRRRLGRQIDAVCHEAPAHGTSGYPGTRHVLAPGKGGSRPPLPAVRVELGDLRLHQDAVVVDLCRRLGRGAVPRVVASLRELDIAAGGAAELPGRDRLGIHLPLVPHPHKESLGLGHLEIVTFRSKGRRVLPSSGGPRRRAHGQNGGRKTHETNLHTTPHIDLLTVTR